MCQYFIKYLSEQYKSGFRYFDVLTNSPMNSVPAARFWLTTAHKCDIMYLTVNYVFRTKAVPTVTDPYAFLRL